MLIRVASYELELVLGINNNKSTFTFPEYIPTFIKKRHETE